MKYIRRDTAKALTFAVIAISPARYGQFRCRTSNAMEEGLHSRMNVGNQTTRDRR